MASFSSKTSFNGEFFKIAGMTDGSVSVSSKYGKDGFTFEINSKKDVDARIEGNLDAKVIGSKAADTFDFSKATGDYDVRTRDGNDRITDGIGNNTFDGGAGQDTFVFNKVEGAAGSAQEVEIDIIKNYNVAEDSIVLCDGQTFEVTDDQINNPDEAIITFSDGDRIVVQGSGVTRAAIEAELGIA
ncbi:MAG: hypothetical protein HC900_13510 [Methylacidiphilales bacterium]|nr:hypothetical protein [Candidatus Methylacidiphilales bacterium]